MKWKSHDRTNQQSYNCRLCRANNRIEKENRICFLDNDYQLIPYPVFIDEDDKGNKYPKPQPLYKGKPNSEQYQDVKGRCVVWQESNVDDLYEYLAKMNDYFIDMPIFKFYQAYMMQVCPESLLDYDAMQVFRRKAMIKEFGTQILEVSNEVFESLEWVLASENAYENEQNFIREQEYKSKVK